MNSDATDGIGIGIQALLMMNKTLIPDQITVDYHYLFVQKNIRIRYGVMTCPKAPVNGIFLLLHGRSEFIEKYKGIASLLLEKKFHVTSLDWRGQGLSSRELENRHKGYIKQFDAYVDDFSIFYSTVIEPQQLPVYILAHSMGGHIALRFMNRYPSKIKKAVLASPMIDIALPVLVKPVSKFVSKILSRTSFSKKYTMGSKDYSARQAKYQGNNLTHDPEKYWILHEEIKNNPDLAIGGITWGWLNAAFESIKFLKQDNIIEKITTPILMVSAQKDSVVSSKAQKKLSRKLPDCRFLSIDGAFHELLFEESRINYLFWGAFDRFVVEGL